MSASQPSDLCRVISHGYKAIDTLPFCRRLRFDIHRLVAEYFVRISGSGHFDQRDVASDSHASSLLVGLRVNLLTVTLG
jgi:hypothetical protein